MSLSILQFLSASINSFVRDNGDKRLYNLRLTDLARILLDAEMFRLKDQSERLDKEIGVRA